MNWYMEPWKKYAEFTGRARRKEYWIFTLVNTLIYLVLFVFAVVSAGEEKSMFSPVMVLFWIFCLAAFIPSLSCGVRRLHDTGKSGWWLLIAFVPFVGGIILLVLMVIDSTPGVNEYGPNPKGL
ncbi:MAG: DUF805 domain-containing protein [Terracidiphilus sp.]